MLKLNLQMFAEEPKDPEHKDPEHKDPEHKEPEDKDPENKDPEHKEPKDPEHKEPETKEPHSLIQSVREEVRHIKEAMHLITEKVDKVYELAKETKEEMAEAALDLRETTGLIQTVIGDLDAQAQALAKITVAQTKMHKEQMAKK